jgi:putative salt-induced outer membrane protein YdiY
MMLKQSKKWGFLSGISVWVFLMSAGVVWADKVILENGDTLSGTVEKVLEGKLTLKTDYSGPIEIQVSKIKKIYTNNPAEVHLTSGEILKGKIETKEDGQIMVEKSAERETTSVEWPKVASINPPAPKQWSGNLNIGGNIQTGNTDRRGISVAAQALRKTDKDKLSLGYLFNYAEENGKMTARNQYGEASYGYFLTKQLYAYGAVELLNDKFKDYQLRTIVGPGLGYQVWDDPVKSLSFEAGLSYQNNNYYEGSDASFLTARLGGLFRYKLFDFVTFSDKLLFYPSIGQGGEYTFRNEAALTVPLSSRWALKLANIIDYASDPPAGVKKTDAQYILSLQVSF